MSSDRTERLVVVISEEEFRALEDYRFRNRMPSRAEALRALLRGLQPDPDCDEDATRH
jgi:PHD/YefM family antitoxin component YafN of YafNO toxin-antitoxin module